MGTTADKLRAGLLITESIYEQSPMSHPYKLSTIKTKTRIGGNDKANAKDETLTATESQYTP